MDRPAFRDGTRDIVPAMPPNVPFGMLFGAAAVDVGLNPAQATALSLFTFAATAQVAAVELIGEDAALPVVLATVFVINLRYVVYSASLAPHVRHLSMRWRAIIAYPLFDITYALAIARFRDEERDDRIRDGNGEDHVENDIEREEAERADGKGKAATSNPVGEEADRALSGGSPPGPEPRGDRGHRGWYYLGCALPFVLVFTVSTLAGALIGRTLGRGLDLDFAIPLIFIALLVPTLDDRESVYSAVVAAAVAVVAAGLPFNTGLLLGLLCGTGVGAIANRMEWYS